MPSLPTRLRRRLKTLRRNWREFKFVVKGVLSTDHPVQVHIVPMRRCNLSCTYCNEFDDVSKPVALEAMIERVDKLAALGTTLVTISGGEPLLHPDLDAIISRVREHGILSGMITNGYLLTADRIQRLNQAGLEHLQISIDNVQPDEVSKKSLKVLDKKLQLLAEHAEFHVNINSVLGSGVKNPQDALTIANRAIELGFTSTVGIIHDGSGQLKSLKPEELAVFDKIKSLNKSHYSALNGFQENIAHGKPNEWRCRSGARYLYICEDGLVHYCSQQRGYPGIPLLEYTVDDIRREFLTQKQCAPNCTVSCAHQTAIMDYWRAPQTTPAFRYHRPRPQPEAQHDGRDVLVQVE
jgi:MoaA/NifB/PqqE/SkfB family radical SAM enzyme